MSWLRAPPSDQDENAQPSLPRNCGDPALIEFREPRMTVRVKGVLAEPPPTASSRPGGSDVKGQLDGLGVHAHRPRIPQPARVRCGEGQLEVGGVLVVGRAEGAARDAREVLDVVRVAVVRVVGSAVLEL